MSQTILLRGAKQLLTLRGPSGIRLGPALGDLAVIEDGSVLIRDGVIAAINTTRRMENLKEARNALEISASGFIVMPGFVDPNFTLSLQHGTRPGESARKRRRVSDFHDASLDLMRRCLQHGTMAADVRASADAPTFHADIAVMRQLAKIASTPVSLTRTLRLNRFPDWGNAGELQDFSSTLRVLARRKLIDAIEVTISDDLPQEHLLIAAREAELDIKLVWTGADLGVLSEFIKRWMPKTVACSATAPLPYGTAGPGSQPVFVFSPGAEIEASSAQAMRQSIDAGAAIALSSGHHTQLAPGFSMQIAVSLAIIRGRLTAEEAISAATVNAAYAAGFGASLGTLEAGKRADILVLTVPHYHEISRQFGINHVGMVIQHGELVYNRMRWKAGA